MLFFVTLNSVLKDWDGNSLTWFDLNSHTLSTPLPFTDKVSTIECMNYLFLSLVSSSQFSEEHVQKQEENFLKMRNFCKELAWVDTDAL